MCVLCWQGVEQCVSVCVYVYDVADYDDSVTNPIVAITLL